ncbi:hypothetical protein ZWY2020_025489 [Hordeum vulgare]|nr:hypothetical protein ZWY2020_025489 [Hordeum vulgare]
MDAADAVVANGVLAKVEEEREARKRYWEEHSTDLTVEAMMLDSRAADLDKEERPEVIKPFHRLVPVPLISGRWLSASISADT